MEFQTMKDEPMYALVAPDGVFQPSSLAPDFATCIAFIKLNHKKGLSKSYHELCVVRGFKILPVKISVSQNGTENKPFEKHTDSGLWCDMIDSDELKQTLARQAKEMMRQFDIPGIDHVCSDMYIETAMLKDGRQAQLQLFVTTYEDDFLEEE